MSDPRRYLFVTLEGGGNLAPVLGAARRLIDAGERVRVLSEPCVEAAARDIGAEFTAFTEVFTRTDRNEEIFFDWQARSPPAALARSLQNVLLGPAGATAAQVAKTLDAHPADVLVADWLLPAALAAGEARKLPTATLVHCINMLPAPGRPAGPFAPARGPFGRLRDRALAYAFRALVGRHTDTFNAMRASLGLRPLAHPLDQYALSDRVIVQTSPAFDFVADREPANVVYVGPVLDDPTWLDGRAWRSPWPEDDPRPLVLLSLSSTFQDQRALLQTAIDALGSLDVRGLVTLGPAMAKERFSAPANVVVLPSAPHSLVLPRASAFITHCGHGSVMRSLAAGVPLVALPMGRDQDASAARIVHRGLGLRPRRAVGSIARDLRRVLEEPSFRAAARGMADTLRREAEDDRLLSELRGLGRERLREGPALQAHGVPSVPAR